MEACSLFGHHNVPDDIKNKLNNLLVDLIENQKVSLFYVGNHGQFDSIARGCLRELKKKYPQISYYVVLAYLPQNPKPYEDYRVKCFESEEVLSFTVITFHQSLFKDVKGDNEFLRAFHKRENEVFNVYKAENLKDFSICEIADLLKSYTNKNLGFIHFYSAVSTIISQLDIAYDEINAVSSSATTNDISVKVWDYVTSNCMSMITAEEVCEKFYVSKWYVDKVTKRFYGKPFHQTIKSMRMWHAKALMIYKHSLIKISKHCGYTDYSAFYRAYTSFFGVSPKNEYQYYLKNKSFLSDKKNNTITNLD